MLAMRKMINKSKLTPFVSFDLIVLTICGMTIIEKRTVAIQPNTCAISLGVMEWVVLMNVYVLLPKIPFHLVV